MIRRLYQEHKETAHNFFWRALQLVSKQGISVVIFFIAAKYLTPYDFGILNYVMAVVVLLMVLCDFGISTATSKYVAEYRVKDPKKVSSIAFSSFIVIFAIATVIAILTVVLGPYLLKENYVYVLYLIPYLYLVPLSSTLDGIYRGSELFKKLATISVSVGVVSLALSFLLIKQYLLIGAIIAQNLQFLLLTVVLLWQTDNVQFKVDLNITKKITRYSLVIGVASVMYYLYTRADILVLQYFGYTVEIGYYSLVTKLFELLILPFMIFGQVIAPTITIEYARKKYPVLMHKLKKHLLAVFVLSLFIALGMYFLFPILVSILFNTYYTPATVIMFQLLLLTLPIKMMSAVVSNGHTVPTGNAHFSMWTMIPAGILNVILDIIFVSTYGFIGVVYASLICFFLATLSYMSLYYFKLRGLIDG